MKSTGQPITSLGASILVMVFSAALIFSCGETVTEHHHDLEVTLSYTPDPATVNTEITFTFEVEEEGQHVAVSDFMCEIEKEGSGDHEEMEITADAHEEGHYVGTWTFTETGTHEIHFHFMHDNKEEEREFSLDVQ